MNGNQHSLLGLGLLGIFFYLNNHYSFFDLSRISWTTVIFLVFFFSRMPDIDQQGSKINNWFNLAIIIFGVYNLFYGDKLFTLSSFLIIGVLQLTHHRTYIHSLTAGILLALPLYFVNTYYFWFSLIAFVIHLIIEGEFSVFWEKDWY